MPFSLSYAGFPASYESKNTDDAHNKRDTRKQHDDFILAHAAKLKMMMNRAHSENPLTCCFEADNLQNNGKRFTAIDKARKKQDKLHVHAEAERYYHAA